MCVCEARAEVPATLVDSTFPAHYPPSPDEPTSGLDSASALRVMNVISNLAKKENRTIICTIHQPRASILPMFDKVRTAGCANK